MTTETNSFMRTVLFQVLVLALLSAFVMYYRYVAPKCNLTALYVICVAYTPLFGWRGGGTGRDERGGQGGGGGHLSLV